MLCQVNVATRPGDALLCKPPESSTDCDMKHLGAHVSSVSARTADSCRLVLSSVMQPEMSALALKALSVILRGRSVFIIISMTRPYLRAH